MATYNQKENYWIPSSQNQFNFENNGFGRPNQQFDFTNYNNDQQSTDYESYSQQEYLNPNQTTGFSSSLYNLNNFNQGIEIEMLM
jgi:hypothetical protein